MIVIVPIFSKDDEVLLNSSEGKRLLQKFFFSVKNAEEVENLFIFTNDISVLNLSDSLSIPSYCIQVNPENEDSELLPYGTHVSVNYLEKIVGLEFDDLMVLSFRNPLVTPDLIDKAIIEYNASGMASSIGICRSIDHPVQLNCYYQIIDAGFIHLFDNDLKSEDFIIFNNDNSQYKITRPFYFDWASKGIKQKNNAVLYRRICDGLKIKYIPIDPISSYEDYKIKSFPLWIWDSCISARILIQKYEKIISRSSPIMDEKYQLIGLSLNDDPLGLSAFLFQNSTETENILVFGGENTAPSPLLVKYKPIGLSNGFKSEMREIEISDAGTPIHLQDMGDTICGIGYTILGIAQNNSYDFCEPFPHDGKLWTGGSSMINKKTGKQILGRQDFPDVFEPDGTFFITRKNLIPVFEKEVSNGNVGGFKIEITDSIQIKSNFDLLRYHALIKANRN